MATRKGRLIHDLAMDKNNYGNLSEKKYAELLNEIEDSDDDLQEEQAKAEEQIATNEEQENDALEAKYGDKLAWIGSGPNNCRGVRLFGPPGWQRACEASIESRRRKSQKLREDRMQIQREALRQNVIPLGEAIGNDRLKLLIAILTKEHTRMIDKYADFINRRLTALLTPLIPNRLRLCRTLFPDSVVRSPGFLYRTAEESGSGLVFWATPDVPYYFAQGTEQEVLMEHKAPSLTKVDQAVRLYHDHLAARTEKEIKYASLIYQKGVATYFDLLKVNPFWFDVLYKELTKNEKRSE